MNKTVFLLLVLSSLCCSSCFELIEQIQLKKDGSGSLQVTLNMSKSRTRLNSLIKMKTVNGHDVPSKEEIALKVKDIEKAVAKTPGISSAASSIDFENYIITLSCNFKSVPQLNAVSKSIRESENAPDKNTDQFYLFDAAQKSFSRLNKFSLKKEYEKMSNADKEIFATANYTTIYKFESEIKSTSNKESKISASKKAVMLKQNALDIITNKKSVENKITLN